MRLYGDLRSGNCYKVWLLARWLDLPLEWVEVDIQAGDTRTPAFLAMNPNGKIPVLEMGQGDALAESNAILFYLAQGSALWPTDPRQQAEVLKWMFFEQYSHEPYIAVARFIVHYLVRPVSQEARLDGLTAGGEEGLAVPPLFYCARMEVGWDAGGGSAARLLEALEACRGGQRPPVAAPAPVPLS